MGLVVYGLKNCDTCKKAMAALAAAGRTAAFVDIRAEADLANKLPGWLAVVGAGELINKRSTTWRQLTDAERAAAEGAGAAALMISYPTLIKRPVIERDSDLFVGWGADVRAALC